MQLKTKLILLTTLIFLTGCSTLFKKEAPVLTVECSWYTPHLIKCDKDTIQKVKALNPEGQYKCSDFISKETLEWLNTMNTLHKKNCP